MRLARNLTGLAAIVLPVVPGAVACAQTAADADFQARAHAPGVVRFFDFDTFPDGGRNYGVRSGTSTKAQIDAQVKASGAGSLRFDIPSQSGGNAAGDFFANFSADLSVRFGENSEFFVQWRQRFSPEMVDTLFNLKGGGYGGIKQAIITAGDTPARKWASCEAIGVVTSTYMQHRFPILYDSCTGSATHPPYAGLFEKARGRAQYLLQNARMGCSYGGTSGGGPQSVPAGCVPWVANEWMTFEERIRVGERIPGKAEWADGEVQLWVARENQRPELLVDWRPDVEGYFNLTAGTAGDDQRFGKVYLLPYQTGEDATRVHALAQTWYDELIISTQPIAFPGGHALAIDRRSATPMRASRGTSARQLTSTDVRRARSTDTPPADPR